jgi:IS1 family transposase
MKKERPPLESLSCQNPECQVYLKPVIGGLTVRKIYGEDQIRYLRCKTCKDEFSERKHTMLWNSKIPEAKVEQIADCLADRNSLKGTVRITKTDKSTVKRVRKVIGSKAKGLHDLKVQNVKAKTVEFDERHGFAVCKRFGVWEGTAIDPVTKLTLALVLGNRDEYMAKRLMSEVYTRVSNKTDLLAVSDGFIAYQKHFAQTFGRVYPDYRKTAKNKKSKVKQRRTRKPKTMIRIPRGVAHAVVNKIYQGKRLVAVDSYIAHGTKKRVQKGLEHMGDVKINTSAIERSNLTARSMNATQVRKSAAFARSLESRHSLAWWTTTVYNFLRTSRALRLKLKEPIGRKLYSERTPAMAAGIANHVWTTLELLRVVVPPKGV